MIIVDTPFHVTFRSLCDLPTFAGTGKCKKVFWESDIETDEAKVKCKQCGSGITNAVNETHFKVLSKGSRNLKNSDFKKYGVVNNSEKKQIKSYLAMNAQIMHLSLVKPDFEKRAIAEWMPHGLKEEFSLKS
jgi:hypothetical protein